MYEPWALCNVFKVLLYKVFRANTLHTSSLHTTEGYRFLGTVNIDHIFTHLWPFQQQIDKNWLCDARVPEPILRW